MPTKCVLFVNGASIIKGINYGLFLEGFSDILIKKALKFEFTANINQAEYEAITARMILALEIGDSIFKDHPNEI